MGQTSVCNQGIQVCSEERWTTVTKLDLILSLNTFPGPVSELRNKAAPETQFWQRLYTASWRLPRLQERRMAKQHEFVFLLASEYFPRDELHYLRLLQQSQKFRFQVFPKSVFLKVTENTNTFRRSGLLIILCHTFSNVNMVCRNRLIFLFLIRHKLLIQLVQCL